MAIRLLPQGVQAVLRSGVIVTSPAQAVVELVLNSLDAGATSIAVRVDLKLFKLQVIDNGCGLGLEQLNAIGPRYMTSKCHTLEDLQNNLSYYGFRGEALSSLCEVSSLLVLVSRPQGNYETYCKAFVHGKDQPAAVSNTKRPGCGTTITVQDFMYNMPVRRKRICEAIDLEEIRSHIMSIALMHPQVSFSLRDNSKGNVIFEKHKSTDFLTCFSHIFGQSMAESLAPIHFKSDKFKIKGFISKEPHRLKQIQFIYVNKRLIVKTKLHRLVNALLTKSSILRANGPWRHRPIPKGVSADRWLAFPSPEKKNKFPVFVIEIECANKEYDMCLDPRKTLIEFEDWKSVTESIEEAIRNFLRKEQLVDEEETNSDSQKSKKERVESSEKHSVESEETSNDAKTIQHLNDAENSIKCDLIHDDEFISLPNVIQGITAKRINKIVVPEMLKNPEAGNINESRSSAICSNVPLLCRSSPPNKCSNKTVVHVVNSGTDRTAFDHRTGEYSTMDMNNSDVMGSNTPPIVKFKRRHPPPPVSNLKITKGAYLFRLEEDKKKNISKILKKYDISVAKGSLKQVGKADKESVATSKLIDPTNCNKNVEEKCTEETVVINSNCGPTPELNVSLPEKVICPPATSEIVLPSDLSLCERSEKPLVDRFETSSGKPVCQKQNKVVSHHLKIDDHISEKKNMNTYYKSVHDTDIINIVQDVSLSSLRSENNFLNEEELCYDQIDSESLQRHSDSFYLSPLSNQNNFLTTEDFLHPIESGNNNLCKKKLLPAQQGSKPPLLDLPICGPVKSVCRELLSSLEEKTFHDKVGEKEKTGKWFNAHVCDLVSPSPVVTSSPDCEERETPSLEPDYEMSPYFSLLCKSNANKKQFGYFTKNNVCDRSKIEMSDVIPMEKTSNSKYELWSGNMLNGIVCNSNEESDISMEELLSHASTANKAVNITVEEDLLSSTNSILQPNVPYSKSLGLVDYTISEGSLSPKDSLDEFFSSDNCEASATCDLESEGAIFNPTSDSFHPKKDKKVTFSENYATHDTEQSWAFQSQDVVGECPITSSVDSKSSGNYSPKLTNSRHTLQNMKYQTYMKPLSMSTMELISIPPVSSPYFAKKTLDHDKNTERTGDTSEKMDVSENESELQSCSNNSSSAPLSYTSDLPSSEEIPLTQLTPLQDNDAEGRSMVERNLAFMNGKEKVSVQTDKLPGGNDICASPYFSFVSDNSTKDSSQIEIRNLMVTRKRNGDSDLGNIQGKKMMIKANICQESNKTTFESVNSNENISSQDLLKAYDTAVSNLTTSQIISVSDSNLQEATLAKEINHQLTNTEILDGNKEWLQMTNNEGKIFYFHKRSGMTSFNPPAMGEPYLFTMTRRHEFLPKGMSPLLDSKVPSALRGNVDMTPNSREELHNALLTETTVVDNDLATVKWKGPPGLQTLSCKEMVKTLLVGAENRMRFCEMEVPNSSKLAVKMSNNVYHYSYDKEIFSKLKVIGQWDNKFIMTVVSFENTRTPHVIGVFDQHAVHERIRLEKLMKDYLEEGRDSKFLSTDIDPPIILDLSGKEHRIMSSFKEKFERIGLKFILLSEYRAKIVKVPTCLHNREARERSKGAILKNFLELLIQEYVEFLIKTRGNEPQLPGVLQEVINYEACRGAIKFGDPLTNEECWVLLTNLSKCQLPFYCAHGRPSFVPIFDMREFRDQKQNAQTLSIKQLALRLDT